MAEIMHVVMPYDLEEATLISSMERPPHRSVEESLEWLALEGTMPGERERIITSTALLLEKGADLNAALETAIVWERG